MVSIKIFFGCSNGFIAAKTPVFKQIKIQKLSLIFVRLSHAKKIPCFTFCSCHSARHNGILFYAKKPLRLLSQPRQTQTCKRQQQGVNLINTQSQRVNPNQTLESCAKHLDLPFGNTNRCHPPVLRKTNLLHRPNL